MFRLKMVALFAVPVVLTAVLWVMAVPTADVMGDENARLVGFLLLGVALLSTILVFRSAVATSATGSSRRAHPARSAENEFRRGFVSAKGSPRKQRPPRPSEIIALRRHRIEPRIVASKPAPAPMLAPETIETLKRRLHDRAKKLWSQPAG
jgi:hypothetical protein